MNEPAFFIDLENRIYCWRGGGGPTDFTGGVDALFNEIRRDKRAGCIVYNDDIDGGIRGFESKSHGILAFGSSGVNGDCVFRKSGRHE
jgi:hypothetical protein